jgi:hypothetical protein
MGGLRIPKTPVTRNPEPEPEPDLARERFDKQTDPAVVMAVVNEYLANLPAKTRAKIPRTLRLPLSISTLAQLEETYERFDKACFAWIVESDVDNPALDEVTHFLQTAWLQLGQIALDAERDAELGAD